MKKNPFTIGDKVRYVPAKNVSCKFQQRYKELNTDVIYEVSQVIPPNAFKLRGLSEFYYDGNFELVTKQERNILKNQNLVGLYAVRKTHRLSIYWNSRCKDSNLSEKLSFKVLSQDVLHNSVTLEGFKSNVVNATVRFNADDFYYYLEPKEASEDTPKVKSESKYIRTIVGKCGTAIKIDVYRVLDAYATGNPILDHLIKKALCAGLRGHKDQLQDLKDIKQSIEEAILLHQQKDNLN